MLDTWLQKKLDDLKARDLLRVLPRLQDLADFTSNDYLGLSQSEELFDRIEETLSHFPKRNGSTGSRLLSGNSTFIQETEKKLSGVFKSQSALLFNSGYAANIAVLSSIPQKDDTILYDELAHASIKDGARLSLATRHSFRHNDSEDLEKKILRSRGRVFIVVESIYSMDGDECPLHDIMGISERYGCIIVLDEAHATGVRGPGGSGLSVEKSLHEKVGIRIYTFGKAMGVCGAVVVGSHHLIRYLVNFARPFIYTTAPSPHTIASIGCAFDLLGENMHLQQTLKDKVAHFLSHTKGLLNRTQSASAIQTFIIPGNKAIREVALNLQHKGFDVRPILSPTVPVGTERIRICLHTFNSNDEISGLAEALSEYKPS